MRYFVPAEVSKRHAITVLDGTERRARQHRHRDAGHSRASAADDRAGRAGLRPAGNGLILLRAGLAHLDRPDQQHPVLDGRGAVGADRLDAARHLAPHAPAPADAGRARAGDELPPRDGELHADRHARHGHGRPHHLREPGVLRDDRLPRVRAGRPPPALPLLAARPHRREQPPAAAGTAGPQPQPAASR